MYSENLITVTLSVPENKKNTNKNNFDLDFLKLQILNNQAVLSNNDLQIMLMFDTIFLSGYKFEQA